MYMYVYVYITVYIYILHGSRDTWSAWQAVVHADVPLSGFYIEDLGQSLAAQKGFSSSPW